MYGFHFLVWFLCVRGVRDTQVNMLLGISISVLINAFTSIKKILKLLKVKTYKLNQECLSSGFTWLNPIVA